MMSDATVTAAPDVIAAPKAAWRFTQTWAFWVLMLPGLLLCLGLGQQVLLATIAVACVLGRLLLILEHDCNNDGSSGSESDKRQWTDRGNGFLVIFTTIVLIVELFVKLLIRRHPYVYVGVLVIPTGVVPTLLSCCTVIVAAMWVYALLPVVIELWGPLECQEQKRMCIAWTPTLAAITSAYIICSQGLHSESSGMQDYCEVLITWTVIYLLYCRIETVPYNDYFVNHFHSLTYLCLPLILYLLWGGSSVSSGTVLLHVGLPSLVVGKWSLISFQQWVPGISEALTKFGISLLILSLGILVGDAYNRMFAAIVVVGVWCCSLTIVGYSGHLEKKSSAVAYGAASTIMASSVIGAILGLPWMLLISSGATVASGVLYWVQAKRNQYIGCGIAIIGVVGSGLYELCSEPDFIDSAYYCVFVGMIVAVGVFGFDFIPKRFSTPKFIVLWLVGTVTAELYTELYLAELMTIPPVIHFGLTVAGCSWTAWLNGKGSLAPRGFRIVTAAVISRFVLYVEPTLWAFGCTIGMIAPTLRAVIGATNLQQDPAHNSQDTSPMLPEMAISLVCIFLGRNLVLESLWVNLLQRHVPSFKLNIVAALLWSCVSVGIAFSREPGNQHGITIRRVTVGCLMLVVLAAVVRMVLLSHTPSFLLQSSTHLSLQLIAVVCCGTLVFAAFQRSRPTFWGTRLLLAVACALSTAYYSFASSYDDAFPKLANVITTFLGALAVLEAQFNASQLPVTVIGLYALVILMLPLTWFISDDVDLHEMYIHFGIHSVLSIWLKLYEEYKVAGQTSQQQSPAKQRTPRRAPPKVQSPDTTLSALDSSFIYLARTSSCVLSFIFAIMLVGPFSLWIYSNNYVQYDPHLAPVVLLQFPIGSNSLPRQISLAILAFSSILVVEWVSDIMVFENQDMMLQAVFGSFAIPGHVATMLSLRANQWGKYPWGGSWLKLLPAALVPTFVPFATASTRLLGIFALLYCLVMDLVVRNRVKEISKTI